MGKQIMLVNVHEDETRIVLTENNLLVGLHVQQTGRARKVGNIYRGTVVKVNPAFQAAFVDYGDPRNGFLSLSDVNFNLHKPRDAEKGRPRIQSILRDGQPVMVQIIKEGMGNKGSALTTFVSLAGRYMVMSPNSDRSGVSRKIEDPDVRRQLKEIMEALSGGENLGVIVRTAGIDRPAVELKKDLEALRKEWKAIQGKFDKLKRPGLIYQEPSPIVRVLRDYFSNDIAEVWVDDAEGFQEALRYFKSTLPRFQKRLKLYVGDKSLFSAYRIEEQIEALDSAKVPLKSGGSVVIEATEAMVAIDVNSGRSNQSSDIEDTALGTNMEAAEEIARQLRLRNLGGLIVIDFIDMEVAKNRKQVEKAVADALKGDKARTTIGTISQFGLLELSRQRIDMEISRGLRFQCPTCAGTGHVPTVNSSANNVLRKVRELAATGKFKEIHGLLPTDAANYLLNEKREALRDLEQEFDIHLRLEIDPSLPAGHRITLHGSRGAVAEDEEDQPEMMRADRAPAAESGSEERPGRRRRRRGRGFRGEDAYHPAEASHEPEEQALAADEREEEEPWEMEDTREAAEVLEVDELDALEEPEVESPPARERDRRPDRHEGRQERPHHEAREGRADRPQRGGRPDRPHRGGRPDRPHRGDRGGKPREGERVAAGNGSGNRVEFSSVHIVTDPEALGKLPAPFVRSRPFAAVMGAARPNQVMFDSSQLWKEPAGEVPATVAPKEGGRPKRPGRRPKGRKPAPSAGAGEGQVRGGAPAAESVSPAKVQAAAPAPGPRPPRGRSRGRGRGKLDAAKPRGDQAEVNGNVKPPPKPEIEPPDVNGNVRDPAPRPPVKRNRGRGRGRGTRPPGAAAARPSA